MQILLCLFFGLEYCLRWVAPESERVCQWVCWNRCRKPVHISYQIDLYIPTAISYCTCCPTSLQGTVYKTATSWGRSVLCCISLTTALWTLARLLLWIHRECAWQPRASSWFCISVTYFIYLPMEPRQQCTDKSMCYHCIPSYMSKCSLYVSVLCLGVHCSAFLFTVCHVGLLIQRGLKSL